MSRIHKKRQRRAAAYAAVYPELFIINPRSTRNPAIVSVTYNYQSSPYISAWIQHLRSTGKVRVGEYVTAIKLAQITEQNHDEYLVFRTKAKVLGW